MSCYELIFIARQDISPAQVEALANNYVELFRGQNAAVTKTEYCGLRPLAYPINKNKKGHFVLMNVEGSASALKEIERKMRLSEDVLRYLTVAVEAHDDESSSLYQQSRSYRDNMGWEVKPRSTAAE